MPAVSSGVDGSAEAAEAAESSSGSCEAERAEELTRAADRAPSAPGRRAAIRVEISTPTSTARSCLEPVIWAPFAWEKDAAFPAGPKAEAVSSRVKPPLPWFFLRI